MRRSLPDDIPLVMPFDEYYKLNIRWTDYMDVTDRDAFKAALEMFHCKRWSSTDSTNVRISLREGLTEEQADLGRTRLIEAFERAQTRRKQNPTLNSWDFILTNVIVYPKKISGLIIGASGTTINGIKNQTNVDLIFVEDESRRWSDPPPDGFDRLIIRGPVDCVRAAREEIQHVFVGAREIVRRGPPPAGYSNNNGVGHGHGGIVAKDDDDASVFTLGSVVDKMAGLDLPLPNQGQGQLRQQQKLSVSQDSIFDAEGRNGHHQNGAEKVAKSGVGGGKYGSPPLIAAGAKRTNSKTRGREEPNEDTTFRQPPLPPYNPAPTHQSGGSIDSAPSGGFGAVRRGRPTQAASPVKNGSNSSKALPANSNNAVAQQALAPPRPPPRQNGGGQKTNGYRIMAQNEGNGYRLVNENGDHNMAPAPTNGHRRVGSGNRAEDESDSDNTLHDEASVMVNGNSSIPPTKKRRNGNGSLTNQIIVESESQEIGPREYGNLKKCISGVLKTTQQSVNSVCEQVGDAWKANEKQKQAKEKEYQREIEQLKAELAQSRRGFASKEKHVEILMMEKDLRHKINYCIECQLSERAIVFANCGHLLFCADCAKPVTKCPVCKKSVAHKLTALRSVLSVDQ